MDKNGVYIGKNIEIVKTDLYEIIFRRKEKNDIYLEAVLLNGKSMEREIIGICQMNKNASSIFWAMSSKEILIGNQKKLINRLNEKYNYKYDKIDNEDYEIIFDDDHKYKLLLDEKIHTTKNYSKPKLQADNIAECLKEWIKGVYKDESDEGYSFGIEINTKRHMFVFNLLPHFIYLRAARYICTNQVVVFAQNIRMYNNKGKYKKAIMLPDNKIAAEKLKVDNDNFKEGKSCTLDTFDKGIYWSVKDYDTDKNLIILNGCRGEDYTWEKDRSDQVEAFK